MNEFMNKSLALKICLKKINDWISQTKLKNRL